MTMPFARPSRAAVALTGIMAAAWGVYRPDVRRPFDFVDFPETLLILQQHATFFGQITGLATATLVHARLNLLVYTMIAAKWSVFGWYTPGWQLTRFATMCAIVALTYVLLRRLRLSTIGALAGATVFVVAPPAVRGWIRLTSAEPVVLMLVLLAALLATHFAGARRRVAIGTALAVIAVMVVMTKEILAVTFALPLYLLLTTRSSGDLGVPRIDRTNRGLLTVLVAVIVAALLPAVWVYTHAPVASYGRWYGTAQPSAFDLLAMTVSALIPFVPAGKSTPAFLVMVASYLLLLGVGVSLTFVHAQRGTPERAQARWLLLLAVGLPTLGGALYLPWPNFQLVYALPFLFGEALLVGMAVTTLGERGALGTGIAMVAWCIVLGYAVPEAAGEARRVEAIQFAASELLPRVAQARNIDSTFVAVPTRVLEQRGLFGPRLFLYGKATSQPWPPTRDVSCEDARKAAASSPGIVVVWFTDMCGVSPAVGDVVRRSYRRMDWARVHFATDSMRFDILRAR